MQTLDTLKIGQKAIVKSFTDGFLSLKLVEMGCLPGETVKLTHIAPLGDPLAIEVFGYQISLRKQEAATVVISDVIEN